MKAYPKTNRGGADTALPLDSVTPPEIAAAVTEIETLAGALTERAAARTAREEELRELMTRAGRADALSNLDAIDADVVKLSTALSLEDRAIRGAHARLAVLLPLVATHAEQLSGEIGPSLRESFEIVRNRVAATLAEHFDADALPVVTARAKAFRGEADFQAQYQGLGVSLDYVFVKGERVLSPEVNPMAVVTAHRRVAAAIVEVRKHLGTVRASAS